VQDGVAFPSLYPYFSVVFKLILFFIFENSSMTKTIYLLFILFYSISFAQFGKDMKISGPLQLSPIIFEAIPYWIDDTTSIGLIFLYRVNPAFLFFAKTGAAQNEVYEARGELVVEILDDKDAAVAREFKQIYLKRNSLPIEGSSPIEEIQGALTFKLKKGSYKIVVETKDSESGKSFIDRNKKVDANALSSSMLSIYPLTLVYTTLSNTLSPNIDKFLPMNRGGDFVIGQTGGCLIQVMTPDTSADFQLSWKLRSKDDSDESIMQELHGEQYIPQFGTPVIVEGSKNISFTVKNDSRYSRIIFAPVPLERLETGKYSFTVIVNQHDLKSQKEFSFNVIWPQKPRSLLDFKIAVSALRHIATEEEINQMTVFSSDKSQKAFRDFWRKRNPDTTCAFNPTMAEYYRRVDESIKRFSVGDKPDGYRTDRGRIFILFGSPTIINRLLKPNTAPTEIWTYEKLRQRFTFADQGKTGNYILIKTENF